jgi:hypothetical protein
VVLGVTGADATYAERQGPRLVDVALFGCFAVRVLRPAGIASIWHT